MTNCPNCNAPIEPHECKCKYCGTYYFDFAAAFDLQNRSPVYMKVKAINGDIVTVKTILDNCDITLKSYCDDYSEMNLNFILLQVIHIDKLKEDL